MSKSDLHLTPAEIAVELRKYDTCLGIPEDPNIVELGLFLHRVRKVMISYERVEHKPPNRIYINKNLENVVQSFELRRTGPDQEPFCFGMKASFEDLPGTVAFMVSYDDEETVLGTKRREDDDR